MNKIFKEDIEEILKKYKRAKTDQDIIQCVVDYLGLVELASNLFPNETIDIPLELLMIKGAINKNLDKEKEDINNQIYENLDKLEELYETTLIEIGKYDFNIEKKGYLVDDITFDFYYDFFKNFGNMKEEFKKIKDTEHLFFTKDEKEIYTMDFKSIGKQYMCVSDVNPLRMLPSIAHEMGHVHAMNISYDNTYDGTHFLIEFMSILIETMFYDYLEMYNEDIAKYTKKQILKSYELIMYQALMQVRLMKKYPDAFIKTKLNPKYKEEFDQMINNKYDFQRYSLYSQFYSIDFILAINYYYQLKYGNDFNEIEKFYIEHNCKNNLSELLNNHVDIDSIKQYLFDSLKQRQKKRSK